VSGCIDHLAILAMMDGMKRLPLAQTTDAGSAWWSDIRQAGSRLVFAVWTLVAALGIGLAVASVPARFRELVANTGQPLLSPIIVASLIVGLNILLAGLFIGSALWIVRLKGRAPMALFLAVTLIALGATETGLTGALINPQHGVDSPLLRWLVLALGAAAMAGALLLLFTFPSGQFVPRWTRRLALVWVGLNLLWLLAPETPFNPLNGPVWRATPAASFAVGMVWFASGLAAQGYRYRRVSGLVERPERTSVFADALLHEQRRPRAVQFDGQRGQQQHRPAQQQQQHSYDQIEATLDHAVEAVDRRIAQTHQRQAIEFLDRGPAHGHIQIVRHHAHTHGVILQGAHQPFDDTVGAQRQGKDHFVDFLGPHQARRVPYWTQPRPQRIVGMEHVHFVVHTADEAEAGRALGAHTDRHLPRQPSGADDQNATWRWLRAAGEAQHRPQHRTQTDQQRQIGHDKIEE
jgi:hypothetical protein